MNKFLKLAVVSLIASGCNLYADNSLVFKSNVLVSGSEVMADALLKDEASSSLKDELAAIRVGYIPEPFGTITIDKETLEKKLANIDEKVEIPENITIKRAGSILYGDDVIDCIKSACSEKINGDFQLDTSRVPRTLLLPGNLISYTVEANSENNLGMKLFTVKAETENGSFRQIVQVNISKTINAAKLVRLAKAGEIISEDMVIKEPIELKSDKTNVPLLYEEVLGKTLDRFKSPGTIIRNSDLDLGRTAKKPKAVKQNHTIIAASKTVAPEISKSEAENIVNMGESVEFHVNSGSLSVSIPAKAMQSGAVGDEITLINLQNKKKIRGVVMKKGVVEYAQK